MYGNLTRFGAFLLLIGATFFASVLLLTSLRQALLGLSFLVVLIGLTLLNAGLRRDSRND